MEKVGEIQGTPNKIQCDSEIEATIKRLRASIRQLIYSGMKFELGSSNPYLYFGQYRITYKDFSDTSLEQVVDYFESEIDKLMKPAE